MNLVGLDSDILALQDALREEKKKPARLVLQWWKNRCITARDKQRQRDIEMYLCQRTT